MSVQEEVLVRPVVPALDAILGKAFPIPSDGFVRLVDYMGSDDAIVQAARISYGSGTKKVHEDRGLSRFLMRHRHTTPFEMCELKLHVRVPMDTWRQWIRHRTANVNEYSTRYSEAIDALSTTAESDWRSQSVANKQGSAGRLPVEVGRGLTEREQEFHSLSREIYQERLAAGVAREQARKDLPLSTYTEAYWKIDLHNLLHFLSLRMDSHAQEEIRSYANIIGNEIVRRWCPLTWDAFTDYRLSAIVLTRLDAAVISQLTAGRNEEATKIAADAGWLEKGQSGLKANRERTECEAKLISLGLAAPWMVPPPN